MIVTLVKLRKNAPTTVHLGDAECTSYVVEGFTLKSKKNYVAPRFEPAIPDVLSFLVKSSTN